MTIVLSEKGWVRAAKGHDVDAATLSYRDGDGLLAAVRGRSTQQVAFLDSNGRSYSTLAPSPPSARGNGEPLTGRFSPAPGASSQALATGDKEESGRAPCRDGRGRDVYLSGVAGPLKKNQTQKT